MNVLSIGNSFSEDAQRYLNKIARADSKNGVFTCNLMIGGCPLSTHYRNMKSEEEAYHLQVNGMMVCAKTSLKRALLSMNWDVITLQQVSRLSFNYDSYQPYLNALVAYVKKYCPKAKIAIHETWGYLPESETLHRMGYETHNEMYRDVASCYEKAAKEINADLVLPSGYAMKTLLELGAPSIHRDSIHANDLGRFTIALTWYQALTGRDIQGVDFSHLDFDVDLTAEEIALAKKASYEAVKQYGYTIQPKQ